MLFLRLRLLDHHRRCANRISKASVGSPLEHSVQTFLQVRLILIFGHLLSLMRNYRLFLLILIVLEADVAVAEPFVVVRLGFPGLITTLVNIIG